VNGWAISNGGGFLVFISGADVLKEHVFGEGCVALCVSEPLTLVAMEKMPWDVSGEELSGAFNWWNIVRRAGNGSKPSGEVGMAAYWEVATMSWGWARILRYIKSVGKTDTDYLRGGVPMSKDMAGAWVVGRVGHACW
jgi:hypothetical protein